MQNVQTQTQVIVGKNAQVVFTVVEFDKLPVASMELAVGNARSGMSVGIVPRNPVNKKLNIAEAQAIVDQIKAEVARLSANATQTTFKGAVEEMVEVRTVAVIEQEIAETKEALATLERDYLDGMVKHDVKIAMFNKLDKALLALQKESFAVRSSEVKVVVKAAEEMTAKERMEAETIARWKDRRVSIGNSLDKVRPSDVDHSKAEINREFKAIGSKIDYFKDQMMLNRDSFKVKVLEIQAWERDTFDRIGSITIQVPRNMMQVKQWAEEVRQFVWYPMECFNYNAFKHRNQRLDHSAATLVYQQYHARFMELAQKQILGFDQFLNFTDWLDSLFVEIGAAERFMTNMILKVDKDKKLDEEAKTIALGSIRATVPMYSALWFYLGGNTQAETIVAPADVARIKAETAQFGTATLMLEIKDMRIDYKTGNKERVPAYVRIPKLPSKEKDGQGRPKAFYDVFMTRDIRFSFFNADNNNNLAAALDAFIRTFWGEGFLANPANRNGFNEHCGNCRHKTDLRVHDMMGVDYQNSANPIDTSELGQWGSKMPQWVCGVTKEFMDRDIILDLNESDSFDGLTYTDEEGNVRYPRPGYVVIKNKPVALYTVRAEGTAEACSRCPFYSKSEAKPEKRYAKELEEAVSKHLSEGGSLIRTQDGDLDLKAMKIFVPKYWTDRAQADRMPVFTQHTDNGAPQWELGFPGEFEKPVAIMVQGVGGIEVYTTEHVNKFMNKEFVPQMETFREDEAQVAKLIDIMYNVSFQFANLKENGQATLNALFAMIGSTPVPTKSTLLSRYNRAREYLAKTIQDNK